MTVGILWEHSPCPSSPHENAIERAEITDAGPFALGKYISSSIEKAIVSDHSARLHRVWYSGRDNKPPTRINLAVFKPKRGLSDALSSEQRSVNLTSAASVDALRPGDC